MIKLTKFISFIFIFAFFNSFLAQAQYNSWDGSYHKLMDPHGDYRAMNIFVNIVYDGTVDDPFPCTNCLWPQSQSEGINHNIPPYFTDVYDTARPVTDAHGMMTRIYKESSLDDFVMIGDYMVVNINQTDINNGNYFNLLMLADEVKQYINNHGGYQALLGHNQISDYDSDTNNEIDICNMYVRNGKKYYGDPVGTGNSDINLGNLLMQDGDYYNIENYTITCVGKNDWYTNPTHAAVHEFAHRLIGHNNMHTSGGNDLEGTCPYMGIQGGYGLMGLSGSGIVSCNGYERWRLHWKNEQYNTTDSFIAANNEPSDITYEDGHQSFILRDFVTTGDAIRIKLPNNNTSDSMYKEPYQYLWLENHKIGYNNKLDFYQYKDHNCRPEGEAGVYAYIQVGKDNLSGSADEIWPDTLTDNLKMLSAEGNFDYSYGDSTYIDCVTDSYQTYDSVEQPNPFNGFNDLMTHIYDRDNNGIIQAAGYQGGDDIKMANAKYYPDGTYNDSLIQLFDMHDAFTDGMIMNMGTNPAPVNAITYFVNQEYEYDEGNIQPIETNRNSRYIVLSGLMIHFTELANHDMKVDIYWNEYDISNDTRWTGNIMHSEELYINGGVNLDLDLNLSPNKHLEDSLTGVFSENTKMYCRDGSKTVQEPTSVVTVKNMSELILHSGSRYVIQDGAELRIKPESKLIVEPCAELIVEDGGQLIVENNATICIEQGARISLHDASSIDLQPGYLTGDCLQVTEGNIHDLFNIPPTHKIQNATVWSNKSHQSVMQDIVVEDGGELTLSSCSLEFDEYANIVVKTGGRLNVNRTILTNNASCENNKLWPGIEVWGNPNEDQIPLSNQGMVSIDSASTISNAHVGVLAYGDPNIRDAGDTKYKGATGGIIQAKDAHFLNNEVAVEFAPYPYASISYFDACHFETTDTLLENKVPDYFVKLYGVEGIEMDSCVFENNSSTDYFGNGIHSSDAHYSLDGNCTDNQTPCSNYEYSKMRNLNYAIKAEEHNQAKYIDVRHTRFTDNYKGVYMSSINDARFTSNVIEVPLLQTGMEDSYGLYLENCNGYHVENNEFVSTSPGTDLGNIGMYILNSGPYYNLVYNNEFTSLGYGIMAVGENRNGTDDGLCFKCNDFEGVNTDILVTPEDGGPTGDNIGIAHHQGSMASGDTAAAGNTFTENLSVLEYNLDNSYGAEDFWYYYHGNNETEEKIIPDPVNDTSTIHRDDNDDAEYTKESACPSQLQSGGGGAIDEMRTTMETSSQEASQTEATLQTLVDDGNTQQLNFEVLSSLPYEAQQLYLDLMSKSPYLSDTVLKSSAVKEEVLTDMLIRDVMVSNPQSAKEDEVIEKLENWDDPLPDYMMTQIMAGLDSIGAKEILERELAGHRTRRQSAYRDLHRIFKTDTALTGGSDSLMNLLQEEPDVSAKYELAFMHLDREEYGQAQSVVNSIPGQFELTEEQAAEQADFTQLINVLVEADQDSLLFPSYDSTQIVQLKEIKENRNGRAAIYARNILVAAGEMDWTEPVYIPISNKSAHMEKDEVPNNQRKQVLEVYPNPAKDFIIAEYKLDELKSGKIIIMNAEGKSVRQIPLKYAQDKVNINVKQLSNGVYFLKLSANGNNKQTVKFSILK